MGGDEIKSTDADACFSLEPILTERVINWLVQAHQMLFNHLSRLEWILPLAIV